MINKFIKNYYELFDEKLNNGTIIVLIIGFIIAGVGNITHAYDSNNTTYIKSSIIESQIKMEDFIEINGRTYKLVK